MSKSHIHIGMAGTLFASLPLGSTGNQVVKEYEENYNKIKFKN